jgi:membrane-associated phospholipid phosphatase
MTERAVATGTAGVTGTAVTESAAAQGPVPAAGTFRIGEGLRPVDWFSIAYLGLTSLLLLVHPGDHRSLLLLAGHLLGIGFLLAARRLGVHRFRLGEWFLALYPLPLFGFLYTEVGYLDRLLHPNTFFDADIQAIERTVFGGFPSSTLYLRFSARALGEYLHLGYTTYYFLAPVLVLTLWLRRRREAFDLSLGTISLAFYCSFLIFVLYPVAGPYHTLTRPPVEELGYVLPGLARAIVDRGSAIGAAFPSSHAAVAVTVWIMAIRFQGGLAVAYAFLVPALAVGAVYGGFHYATDIVAGVLLGILMGTGGLALTKAVCRRVRPAS